jgi:hypothetical protein
MCADSYRPIPIPLASASQRFVRINIPDNTEGGSDRGRQLQSVFDLITEHLFWAPISIWELLVLEDPNSRRRRDIRADDAFGSDGSAHGALGLQMARSLSLRWTNASGVLVLIVRLPRS